MAGPACTRGSPPRGAASSRAKWRFNRALRALVASPPPCTPLRPAPRGRARRVRARDRRARAIARLRSAGPLTVPSRCSHRWTPRDVRAGRRRRLRRRCSSRRAAPPATSARSARGRHRAARRRLGMMRSAYPAAFLAMIAEGAVRGGAPVLVVAAARRCSRRQGAQVVGDPLARPVVDLPGDRRPRHAARRLGALPVDAPSQLRGVLGELAGVALMTGAPVAGPITTARFGFLIVKRISREDVRCGRGPGGRICSGPK